MAAVRTESSWSWVSSPVSRLIASETRGAAKQIPCWAVLGLGIGNLVAGLVFGTGDRLPTFIALDVVYANFAWAPWIVVIYLGAQESMAPTRVGLAAKTAALALVAAAMLTVAGVAAIACQLWKGDARLDWPLYVAGLYANLGWGTLHLAMLAIALRAILGRRWLSMAMTAALWTGTNLGFEHPLLRLGAPIVPASGMNGLGPFLEPLVALGIHWTGFGIVILSVGCCVAAGRIAKDGGPPRRTLDPNTFAVVWASTAVWLVSGGWIFHQTGTWNAPRADTVRDSLRYADLPQPVYSRLDLDIAINPAERTLANRGTAIVVNRRQTPVPELHFGVPGDPETVVLTTTGEFAGFDPNTGFRRYRLNRPLEPRETLRITFELTWVAKPFGGDGTSTRLVENGTFVSTADLVPALGFASDGNPFRWSPPVAFRARISTPLGQIAVTEGDLVRAWKEEGRSFFEYQSPGPISPFATIHAGNYAIRREQRDEGVVEVYHHRARLGGVDAMLEAGRTTVALRGESSQRVPVLVRIVEVPGYSPFRRLGFLGFGKTPAPGETVPGAILPYSERGFPLSTPPPNESTLPRA